ncbi:MAG: pyridoxamine 5'-phosphate oxidase family protein [Treponema sp.]|nr:pyridoxamine 5'-phosphate oxidase family protein [Treponema sp.]
MELNYSIELEKIYACMGESKIMALATSGQNYPTVRMMSCIIYQGNIIFQTGTDLLKYKQIIENNNVALCVDTIQIAGIATILGKTKDTGNQEIMERYKAYYKSSYETYSHHEKEVLIEVMPRQIVRWDYDNGKPYRIFIDLPQGTAYKAMYL